MILFQSLTRGDFNLLASWLATPHVARWWNHQTSPEALEADFGASLDGADAAELFIATYAGRPLGFVQRYLYGDNPGYMADVGALLPVPAQALSIDYFVGPPEFLREGLGAAMIAAAVAAIWRDYPQAPSVIVPVSAANTASWKVLERAGFARVAAGLLEPDNPVDGPQHYVYRIERPATG